MRLSCPKTAVSLTSGTTNGVFWHRAIGTAVALHKIIGPTRTPHCTAPAWHALVLKPPKVEAPITGPSACLCPESLPNANVGTAVPAKLALHETAWASWPRELVWAVLSPHTAAKRPHSGRCMSNPRPRAALFSWGFAVSPWLDAVSCQLHHACHLSLNGCNNVCAIAFCVLTTSPTRPEKGSRSTHCPRHFQPIYRDSRPSGHSKPGRPCFSPSTSGRYTAPSS